MRRVSVEPCNDNGSRTITVCTPLSFEFEYWNLVDNAFLHLSIHIFNAAGVEVINALPAEESVWNGRPLPRGLFRSVFYLPGNLLNDGSYHVAVHVVKDLKRPILQLENVLTFEVEDNLQYRGIFVGKWYGVVRPRLQWMTEHVTEKTPERTPS
jgi:lipopolysaccharide transport system ATP-binding protein